MCDYTGSSLFCLRDLICAYRMHSQDQSIYIMVHNFQCFNKVQLGGKLGILVAGGCCNQALTTAEFYDIENDE